jgi:hypothetical protein
MSTSNKAIATHDRKAVLSTLWIFLAANYIYCDLLSHMEPAVLRELITTGTLGSIQVTQVFLLSAAIMMEIPFAMILLSRVLPYRVNRWANIIAGAIMVAIQVGTMGMGTPPTLHYLFYSAIEVACNLFIVWYAWKWTNPEG